MKMRFSLLYFCFCLSLSIKNIHDDGKISCAPARGVNQGALSNFAAEKMDDSRNIVEIVLSTYKIIEKKRLTSPKRGCVNILYLCELFHFRKLHAKRRRRILAIKKKTNQKRSKLELQKDK